MRVVRPCDGVLIGGPGEENDLSSVGYGEIPQQHPDSAGKFVCESV